MHRIAVVAVLAAALGAPVLLQAQARSMGGRIAPPARSAPPRAMASPSRVMPTSIRPAPGTRFHGGVIVVRPHRRFHRHHVIFKTPCFAPNWVNPLCQPFFGFPFVASYPYVYPPMAADYSSQPAQQVQQPVYVQDNSGLRDEVSRLADEVQRLRDEQAQQRTPAPSARETPAPTTLVYRDGRRVEVQNYAIVGQTLWVFNETHARKVPLSELDLTATRAVNEQRGVEFLK